MLFILLILFSINYCEQQGAQGIAGHMDARKIMLIKYSMLNYFIAEFQHDAMQSIWFDAMAESDPGSVEMLGDIFAGHK